MKEDKIKILILNYNGKKLLKECLDSVLSIDYSNYSTILIDNGSLDKSIEYVKSLYHDNIEIVETGRNRLYAGGYNFFFSKDSEDCYYLILNNDTIVDKNILKDFMSGVNKYGQKNIYGCSIMFADEKNKIWYAGSEIDLYKGIIRHRNIRNNFEDAMLKDGETDYVTGCCMLVHSSIVRELSGFDESFKMYMEDVDFCMRARSLDIKSYFLASPKLYHYVSSSVHYKSIKVLLSYIKLSFRYTRLHVAVNAPLFFLRKIFSRL